MNARTLLIATLCLACLAAGCGRLCGKCGGEAARVAAEETTTMKIEKTTVEAACGQCQFDLPGEGCDLAIRSGGEAWFVDGTHIDSHGDAHADDGLCNAIRRAEVTGSIEAGRFVAAAFRLLPEAEN